VQQSHVQTHGARSLRRGGAGRQAARGDPSLVRDAIISWLRMHEETIAAGFVFPSLVATCDGLAVPQCAQYLVRGESWL